MLKRTLIAFTILLALLGLAVATLPWWLGGVLRHYGTPAGVTFSSYANVGYTRWAIEDVRWLESGIILEADRVEAPHPLVWWWRKSAASAVSIDGVKLDLQSMEKSDPESEAKSAVTGPWSAVLAFHDVRPLLPPIEVSFVAVLFANQRELKAQDVVLRGLDFSIAEASIDSVSAALTVKMEDPAKLGFGGDLLTFDVRGLSGDWSIVGNLSNRRPQSEIQGQWHGQKFSAFAAFPNDQWFPEMGNIVARDWEIPGAEVGLGDYYQMLNGNLEIRLNGERVSNVNLTLQGQPLAAGEYPPLSIGIHGSTDMESAEVESLQVSMPGLLLASDNPFTISRDSLNDGAVSHLRVNANLAEFPMIDGHGTLDGNLKLTTRRDQWPLMEFALNGSDLSYGKSPRVSGIIGVDLAWPRWEVSTLKIEDRSGSELRIKAIGDGIERRIELGQWDATIRPGSLDQWLSGQAVTLGEILTTGEFSGTLNELNHKGVFMMENAVMESLNPVSLNGEWKGQGAKLDGEVSAISGDGRLLLSGELREAAAQLELEVAHGDEPVLWSRTPFGVTWSDGISIKNLNMEGLGLDLQSAGMDLKSGDATVSLLSPDGSWLADWWVEPPTVPLLQELVADVSWSDAGIAGSVDFRGEIPVSESVTVEAQLSAKSDGQSLVVSAGRFGWEGEPIAQMDGTLPIRLKRNAPYWEIDDRGVIDARMVLERSPKLWQEVAQRSRVHVENPSFDLALSGTWARPAGAGQLSVSRIVVAPMKGESAWPVITEIEAQLIDDGSGLEVEPLTARFDGQLITMRGRLPFTPGEWQALSEEPLRYFREQGHGSVSIPRANLAALAKFVPDMLVPTGEVDLALEYSPDQGVNGQITLDGAVTRPLGPLGALQDVTASLQFESRGVEVMEISALVGGQPLTVSGNAQWPESGSVVFDLALAGKNLPLVRNTGVLLRSDLNLRIRSDASGAGEVSGAATLRDGLVLVDVRSLVPRGGGAVVTARRPPYFSVEVAPINRWGLDVEVSGERFLRLRTPVITGTASVDGRLLGTLETPRMIGEITLDEGELRLPFARLSVDDAYARLTEADPYDPEIRLEAVGQRLGYDLTMELSGKASEPRLNLQASPLLSSEEVLLLVMAGVTPRQSGQGRAANRALKLGMYLSQGVLGELFGTDENERLSVSSGEKLSRQGKETYRFDYDVADRWTLVAEYDEFDHYNAAIKWRVKPGAAEPTKPGAPPELPMEKEEAR